MKTTMLDYYTAKIYELSGQPKFRGCGSKRKYNPYFDFARFELLFFLERIADFSGKKKAVRIARTFCNIMKDEEKAKKMFVVCPMSEKQAYVLADFALDNEIGLLGYIEITMDYDKELWPK